MTDIELLFNESNIPARSALKDLHGNKSWVISAGGRLRVQTKEYAGAEVDDVVDETVPVGKMWSVTVQINIIETDA